MSRSIKGRAAWLCSAERSHQSWQDPPSHLFRTALSPTARHKPRKQGTAWFENQVHPLAPQDCHQPAVVFTSSLRLQTPLRKYPMWSLALDFVSFQDTSGWQEFDTLRAQIEDWIPEENICPVKSNNLLSLSKFTSFCQLSSQSKTGDDGVITNASLELLSR